MALHAELTPAEAADRLAIRELFDAYAHCLDQLLRLSTPHSETRSHSASSCS